MSENPSLQELLDFFRIEQADLDLLATLRETMDREADRVVDEFYRHLLQQPATQVLLRNGDVRARLLKKQRDYLMSLTEPTVDEAYVAARTAIGTVHERIGLETRWYLGSYSHYFQLLQPIVSKAMWGRPRADRQRAITALAKRLLFDAELAIHQYVERREEDLQHLNRELTSAGQKLAQAMGQTSRDLELSQARAQAAERLASVATLVSGLAHEIGTPMGVLRGHAEALTSAVEGERAKWRLQMILEQIDRITTIIQSLLNIARPRESLRMLIQVDEVVEAALGFLADKLVRRGVKVDKDLEPGVQIQGDPEKLQQILLNLILNAVDAMPDGGLLGVSVSRLDGENVVIRISDTGAGISQDALVRVFDPFFTTKAAGHGSGLGLVVVKGIVEEHGGEIDLESEPGNGTHITIRIPAG